MKHNMKPIASILFYSIFLGLSIGLLGQTSVSQDIHITKGDESRKNVTSVSGDVVIGGGAKLKASVSTVSGDVEIGAKSEVKQVNVVSGDISVGKGAETGNLESVSGDIRLYARSDVRGSIETVSGDVICNSGCKISNNLTTVSGDIELDDSILRGDLKTVSGDIALFNGSIIEGDIIIDRKSKFFTQDLGKLKVIVDMNSVVKGSIRVKEADTNVIVYLTNGGKVKGEIINAEIREQ
ncbi:DUF4097 family beta strand repeat protein [bacterium]|nr:DUF4097 family beta strand repeat protein [bacterium]